jgi:hypothetical protein
MECNIRVMQPPELISKPSGIPLPPREGWTFPMKHTHTHTHTHIPHDRFTLHVHLPQTVVQGSGLQQCEPTGKKTSNKHTLSSTHTDSDTQTHRYTDTRTHTGTHTPTQSHQTHTHTHSHTHTLIHFSTTVSHLGNMYRFATWQDIWREYRR